MLVFSVMWKKTRVLSDRLGGNLPLKHIVIGGCGFCVGEGHGTSIIWCVVEAKIEVKPSVCSLLLYVKLVHSFI